MTAGPSFREIRAMLQLRAGQLARELAPGGTDHNGAYIAPNPTRNDHKAGSFRIYTSGPRAGGFVDYAGVNANFMQGGDRGDVIDLIAYTRTNRDRVQAVRWAEDWLGIRRMKPEDRRKTGAAAKRQMEDQDREAEAAVLKREARARALVESARVGLAGTVAEIYLAGRGILLAEIPTLNLADIRFHPALEWWEGAVRDASGYTPGPKFPAIVCAFRDREGIIRAVHCTFLAPDGAGKAKVSKPKLMFGTVTGCVIRLTNGSDGLVLEESGVIEPVTGCEGVETGLSIAMAVPESRVWPAGSLGNIGNIYLDHPLVSAGFIARDNDWDKPQAIAQFDGAMVRLEAHGKPLAIVCSPSGNDFNDPLQGT